jgi:antitoxin YefM
MMDDTNISQRDVYAFFALRGGCTTLVQEIEQVEASMRAINYSEVRNNLATVLDAVVDDAEVAVVTRRGDPDGSRAVYLVPARLWESMEETAYLLSGANREHILESVRQSRAGEVVERQLIEDE